MVTVVARTVLLDYSWKPRQFLTPFSAASVVCLSLGFILVMKNIVYLEYINLVSTAYQGWLAIIWFIFVLILEMKWCVCVHFYIRGGTSLFVGYHLLTSHFNDAFKQIRFLCSARELLDSVSTTRPLLSCCKSIPSYHVRLFCLISIHALKLTGSSLSQSTGPCQHRQIHCGTWMLLSCLLFFCLPK